MPRTTVKTTQLGNTGLDITRVGFGAWAIGGGGYGWGWGSLDRHGTTPGAVAIAWTLRNPAVDGAIVGFRRSDQVDRILVAANLELDENDMAVIEGRA
jgi:aryl-alcohol dehydrogenase-like predicted oxidoreductase